MESKVILPVFVFAFGLAVATAAQSGSRSAEDLSASDGDASRTLRSNSMARFLIVGKPKIADSAGMQERAAAAVRLIAGAAKKSGAGVFVDVLAEGVWTKEQYRRGEVREQVTGKIFRERLAQLTKVTSPLDTVVIYTHSHGRKDRFEESQPLGGLVLDLPVRRPEHRGTFLWDEYADLLLKIPAKNVVVLTMSCFSGGLVEYLDSPQVKHRWQDRREKLGRNLIVLTSQDKNRMSNPIAKGGEVINPFTYAVAKALAGEADGFRLAKGKPVASRTEEKDGKLTAGELVDYILYTTENTASERARLENTAKPQLTGSFSRGDVLGVIAF